MNLPIFDHKLDNRSHYDVYWHYNGMTADLEMKPLVGQDPAEIEKWRQQTRDKTYEPNPTIENADYRIQVKNINIR